MEGQITQGVSSSPQTAAKNVESLAVNLEHLTILAALGEAKASLGDDALFDYYQKQFPKKSRVHFKIVINELKKADMINEETNIYDKKFYSILSKGLDVLGEHLARSKTG
jgi:hypothetical protein